MESYLARLTVADIMQTNTVSLSPETGLFEALGTCRQQGVDIALVMKAGTLVGTIGLQDIMRGLWSEEYSSKTSLTVADLMCAEFTAVRPCLKVNQLIETLVVNKEVLFNVNDNGMLISPYLTFEQRLRKASSQHAEVLPVIEGSSLKGVVSRAALADLLLAKRAS